MATSRREAVREAFEEIIEGRTVKRSHHELRLDGEDFTDLFIEVLRFRGYHPRSVRDVPVAPGERAPAFLVSGGVALFGWIFWEKFSTTRMRKFFGSVVRNAKGDWAVQISIRDNTLLYVNVDVVGDMDIDHPAAV